MIKIMRYFRNAFLKLEEKSKHRFEKLPFTHAFFAGVGVVLFWRGVWEVADKLELNPYWSIFLGSLVLMILGLFLQTFVGNTLIIRKVESEKRLDQKTGTDLKKVQQEMDVEEVTLEFLLRKLESIESSLAELKKNK